MIGLHIYNKKLSYSDGHGNITAECGNFRVTLSYHKQYRRGVYFENDNLIVLVDGWIFCGDYEKQAYYVCEIYDRYHHDFPYYLDGQFNVAIIDKNNKAFIFANDIFSFRKHYYRGENGDIAISSDIEFLRDNTKVLSLNHEHIYKNLQLPRFIDIGETFFNQIKPVKPHTMIRNGKISSYHFERVERKYSKDSDFSFEVSKFVEQLHQNIKAVHGKDKILLLLSGGLDSRFMLEMFRNTGLSVQCATYGTKDSDECVLAKRVAECNQVLHFNVNLMAEDFIENARRYMRQVQGLDIFPQSTVYKFYSELEFLDRNMIIDTGFALDVFLGGTYLKETERFENKIKMSNAGMKFHVDDFNRFATVNRVFSSLAIRQAAHREFYEDRYSMYEYRNYFLMRRIPEEKVVSNEYYYDIAKHEIKRSFSVPIQSTMFGLELDPQYWDDAKKIQLKKERLVFEYYRNTQKALYHNRYYSDFDMWLRDNENWLELLGTLKSSLLVKKFLPDSMIKKCVQEHLSARKSHLRNIIKWLSMEMFLQDNRGILN